MVFCNDFKNAIPTADKVVTILILIDGFLQLENEVKDNVEYDSHNPYFNRWFSAISELKEMEIGDSVSQSLF